MSSLLSGFEYDIFVSYRQKDNGSDQWVTKFVNALREELNSTFKEDISIYFDNNPHDGLHEHHDVDGSLQGKLKSVIFLPIVSRTYCDPDSFAWSKEFVPFLDQSKNDEIGFKVKVSGGNITNRVLPIRIHDLDQSDINLFESKIDGALRPIDFVYKETGVNRPLTNKDLKSDNIAGLDYRNQVNKVANAVLQIMSSLRDETSEAGDHISESQPEVKTSIVAELSQRDVLRAGIMYIIVSALLWRIIEIASGLLNLPSILERITLLLLAIGFPIAVGMAWFYERGPGGLVRIGSSSARENPFTKYQKKPLTSNTYLFVLVATFVALFFLFPSGNSVPFSGKLDAAGSSLGIIPFRNNSGSDEYSHLGMGFASEVRTKLTRTKHFDFITSEQATVGFKNTTESPESIGSALGVTHLITGSYQVADGKIRINVDLLDASDGSTLWNFPFEGDFEDLFELQSKIANEVLSKFSGTSEVAIGSSTNNLEAYHYFLKGMEFMDGSRDTGERLKAVPLFKKALELDPEYLNAHVNLMTAYCYYYRNLPLSPVVTPEMIEDLVEDLDKFPDVYLKNLGYAIYEYTITQDFDKAEQRYLEVLSEDPQNVEAIGYLGAIAKRRLKYGEALSYNSKLIKLNPLNVNAWNEIEQIMRFNGNYQDATAAAQKVFELNPEDPLLYDSYVGWGKLSEIPEVLRNKYRKRFFADSLRFGKNMEALLHYLDTVEASEQSRFNTRRLEKDDVLRIKSETFSYLGIVDSAKFYANKYLNEFEVRSSFSKIRALHLSGRKEEAIKLTNEVFPESDQVIENNLLRSMVKIWNLATDEEHEKAAKALLKLNKEHPSFGYFQFFSQSSFDKAREDQEFRKALQNVRYPPKLSMEDPLKW